MKSKRVAWTLVVILWLLSNGVVLATPTPPYVFVNHSTRQCAIAIHSVASTRASEPGGAGVQVQTSPLLYFVLVVIVALLFFVTLVVARRAAKAGRMDNQHK